MYTWEDGGEVESIREMCPQTKLFLGLRVRVLGYPMRKKTARKRIQWKIHRDFLKAWHEFTGAFTVSRRIHINTA